MKLAETIVPLSAVVLAFFQTYLSTHVLTGECDDKYVHVSGLHGCLPPFCLCGKLHESVPLKCINVLFFSSLSFRCKELA